MSSYDLTMNTYKKNFSKSSQSETFEIYEKNKDKLASPLIFGKSLKGEKNPQRQSGDSVRKYAKNKTSPNTLKLKLGIRDQII